MKKIHAITSIMLLVVILLDSCTKEVLPTVEHTRAGELASLIDKEDVANLLCCTDIDTTFMRELFDVIKMSLSEGKDEIAPLSQIFGDETLNGKQNSIIVRKMSCINDKGLTRRFINSDMDICGILKELPNSNVIIYWPYSEKWNGKDLPVIVCAPDDENVESCEGFKLSTDRKGKIIVNKMIVNEDYSKLHPVWIVKEAENDKGVVYLKPSLESPKEAQLYNSTRSLNTVNTWKLTKMKVTHQYDSWIAGGSEFDIQVVYPIIPGYAGTSTKLRVEFSRSEISEKREKNLDLILNTNWREEQLTNGILITEADGGSDVDYSISYSYKDSSGGTYSGSYTLHYKDSDYLVGQMSIDRDYVLINHDFVFNGDVFMTMPIIPQ